jgi:hypothetical protein
MPPHMARFCKGGGPQHEDHTCMVIRQALLIKLQEPALQLG